MPRTYTVDARDQYRAVARHFHATIARRPVPADWATRRPVLGRYRSWRAIAEHLLDTGPDADELLRALHDHRRHVDVQLTLVVGIAQRLRGGAISADMIGHLLDLFADPDIDTSDGFDVRLRRAARQRALRSSVEPDHDCLNAAGEILDDEGEPLPSLAFVDDDTGQVDDRHLLLGFRRAVDRAITNGDLAPNEWDIYRAGITRRVDPDRRTPTAPAERMRFMRARRRVHAAVELENSAHTA